MKSYSGSRRSKPDPLLNSFLHHLSDLPAGFAIVSETPSFWMRTVPVTSARSMVGVLPLKRPQIPGMYQLTR